MVRLRFIVQPKKKCPFLVQRLRRKMVLVLSSTTTSRSVVCWRKRSRKVRCRGGGRRWYKYTTRSSQRRCVRVYSWCTSITIIVGAIVGTSSRRWNVTVCRLSILSSYQRVSAIFEAETKKVDRMPRLGRGGGSTIALNNQQIACSRLLALRALTKWDRYH